MFSWFKRALWRFLYRKQRVSGKITSFLLQFKSESIFGRGGKRRGKHILARQKSTVDFRLSSFADKLFCRLVRATRRVQYNSQAESMMLFRELPNSILVHSQNLEFSQRRFCLFVFLLALKYFHFIFTYRPRRLWFTVNPSPRTQILLQRTSANPSRLKYSGLRSFST